MKRGLSAFLCLLLLITASGCWNRREVESLAIVLGAAIDWIEEDQIYEVTVQIAKPAAMTPGEGGGGGGGGQGPAYNVVSGRGHTLFDAVRNMAMVATRRLWWGHMQVILFGESAARRGMAEVLDWLGRDGETRLIYWALVTRGNAGTLLKAEATAEKVPVLGLRDTVKAIRATSLAEYVRLVELLKSMQSPSAATIGLAMLDRSVGPGADGKPQFRVEGSGVIKENRLVGYLTGEETRGVLWVRSRVRSAVLAVACPGEADRWVGVEVIRSSSQVVPNLDQKGRLRIDIRINVEGNVGDQNCPSRFDKPSIVEELEANVEAMVRGEVSAALKRCRALEAECLGLGVRVMQTMPRVWDRVEKRWNEAFLDLPVSVDVDARIRQLGGAVRPMEPK